MTQPNPSPADSETAGKAQRRQKGATDWEAIERDYRTGRYTLRELEAKHATPFATINMRAKREGWTKDLRQVIRQQASAALVAQAAAQGTAQALDAAQAVQIAASQAKEVMAAHRTRAHALAAVAVDMLQELGQQALLKEHAEILAAIVAGEGVGALDQMKAQQAVMRTLALGSRAKTVKALADTLASAQSMERQAWDLDEPPPPPPAVDWNATSPEQALETIIGMLRRAAS